jgi:bifunctional oligoribonuclease and PAP phosphatase NrnA
MISQEAEMNSIVSVLKEKTKFLLMTHKDPDVDGIGSMLALGMALSTTGKHVTLVTEKALPSPMNQMKGCENIFQNIDIRETFDAAIVLDCGDLGRVGSPMESLEGCKAIINIDHHQARHLFGDFNLVDPKSSSTGELVYRVINKAGLPINDDVAENILAAIQADTGSFRYENTTAASLKISGEMMDYGASPHRIFLKMMNETSMGRLKLMEMAIGAVEFYYEGRLGMVMLSPEMFQKAGASKEDSEKFVDYLRYVSGVELAVVIREVGADSYSFSMRSSNKVNVAHLAALFGGGGHARAAGFERHDSMVSLKKSFLKEAGKLLDAVSH